MKILHLSPSFFGQGSLYGGGERYAFELAHALAGREEVVFVTFDREARTQLLGNLRVIYLRYQGKSQPFSRQIFKWFRWADVIHCHRTRSLLTDMAILYAKLYRKKVFITDMGGAEKFALSYHLPLLQASTAYLLLSEYSKKITEEKHVHPRHLYVIGGGVDTEKFHPVEHKKNEGVLYVGRILPHKGIDYLIEAVGTDWQLDIIGRVYHREYYHSLQALAAQRRVHFLKDVNDQQLVDKFQNALVAVLPSVYTDCYGHQTLVPELLGLVVLESMASGTPVIVTNVASLPEVVDDGVDGFIVPPNEPQAIREKIRYLYEHPHEAKEMGMRGRKKVLEKFNWEQVVEAILAIY